MKSETERAPLVEFVGLIKSKMYSFVKNDASE